MGLRDGLLTLFINSFTILALCCIWLIAGGIGIFAIGQLLRKCVSAGVNFVLLDR